MKLEVADWQNSPGVDRLLKALDAEKGSTRIVGGAVRDTLLGLPVADVDLATRLLPDDVMARLRDAAIKVVPTGIAHGTVTAVLDAMSIEITTLRRDVQTDGRRATVAFTDDFEEDAARRDFTINALSADPLTGALFDYFDGLSDLKNRCVRFIGNPLMRIAEDHLRILRFFRFNARFGTMRPDAESLAACAARANDLMALSRERVREEVLRLLLVDDPVPTIELMLHHGIFKPVLPEIEAESPASLRKLVEAEQRAGISAVDVRRFAALLPAHPGLADDIGRRLRLSNADRARLVSAAGRLPSDIDQAPETLAYRIGLDEAMDRLLLANAPFESIERLRHWVRPALPVSGGDLVRRGISKGPVVSRLLKAIEDDWIASGFSKNPDVIEQLIATRLSMHNDEDH